MDGRLAGEGGVGALARLADGPSVNEDFRRAEFHDARLVALDGKPVTGVEGVVVDLHEDGVRAEIVLRHDAEVHLSDGGQVLRSVRDELLFAGPAEVEARAEVAVVDADAGFRELLDEFGREGAGENGVPRRAIGLRNGRDILGVSPAPLDLEGGDAGGDEAVEEGEREEVARGENRVAGDVESRGRVGVLADFLHAVEATAGLAAFAAVGGKAVRLVREEAPARFCHADRAVDEGFDFNAAFARDFGLS